LNTFVGRKDYLAQLSAELEMVRASKAGRFVLIRGRRRVGKSRLVEEFLKRAKVPYLFFTASRQTPERELSLFAEELASSRLPAAEMARSGVRFDSWEAALAMIAQTADTMSPAVLVLDEFSYLVEQDLSIEATLQKVWDRRLQKRPILLIVVGSDISMMAALTQYGRPLYGRPHMEMVVRPLSPSETASMLRLDAPEAWDAYLAVGGMPMIAASWPRGANLKGFLSEALTNPFSPLVVAGERALAAEFPTETMARSVLSGIGSGETTFTSIQAATNTQQMSLKRALDTLVGRKRIVTVLRPLSSRPSRETRYFVADPYLRFWLRFVGPNIEAIERGRGEMVASKVWTDWPTYRGQAIEPLVREAIERLLPDARFGHARWVGGYWNRTGTTQVDLVGAKKDKQPERIEFVGSIKWRERAPFDRHDLQRLLEQRRSVPGTDERTLLVGVSRSGFAAEESDVRLTAEDLLKAWK